MSRMMDADKFLSWLSEVEGEIRKEKMKECQPDRYDDGQQEPSGSMLRRCARSTRLTKDMAGYQ